MRWATRIPSIQATLKRQAGRLIHVSNLFFHEYQAELAKRLTKISGLDKAFFCNSGTEAWEGALKLARAFARTQNSNGHKAKWRMLALENSFHGRTFGSSGHHGAGKISPSLCAAGAGSRISSASMMLTI